jgi:hypothetical protein
MTHNNSNNNRSSIRKRHTNNNSKAISKGKTKMMIVPDSLEDKNHAHSMKQRSMIPVILVVTAVILIIAVIGPVDETIIATSPSTSHHRRIAVTSSTRTQMGTYRLIQTVSHDSNAFTQGLVTVYDPSDETLKFYEGTGLNGQSQLRLVNIDTGTVVAQHSLPFRYFGEGITHYLDNSNSELSTLRIIQLTWQEQTAFEYEIANNTTSSSTTTYAEWLTRVHTFVAGVDEYDSVVFKTVLVQSVRMQFLFLYRSPFQSRIRLYNIVLLPQKDGGLPIPNKTINFTLPMDQVTCIHGMWPRKKKLPRYLSRISIAIWMHR